MLTKLFFFILFLFQAVAVKAQMTMDTVMFTLHCIENEVEVEENLQNQLDSMYKELGFFDSTKVTTFQQAIVFGFTDSKGSKRSNQLLSEKRANYVYGRIKGYNRPVNDIIVGLGEAEPVAENKTAAGRAKNRRVEVTLVYTQRLLPPPEPKIIYADTIIVFEDSSMLQINLEDYYRIKDCLKYERKTSLFDLFEDLPEYNNDETYYNFGKVSISWCGNACLGNAFLLSIRIPDSLARSSLKDLKVYVRQAKKQRAALSKHKDGHWYIDITSRCTFGMPHCMIGCGHGRKGGDEAKMKKVHYVAKDGYRIIGASISNGELFNYRKEGKPKRKIKFKVRCPSYYPVVSIVAVRKDNSDTIYYASGTEREIAHGFRCANCDQKKKKEASAPKQKIKNRFLRKKYKFRKADLKQMLVRKKIKPGKK
jgi:hypothetical protein